MSYKILEISQFKGETLRIDFDGRDPIFVNTSVVYDLGLKEGSELDEKDIEGAILKNDYRRARERALYLLDERDYGYVEMFRKLERNYSEDICYKVVNSLAEAGLIDDRRYARKCAEYYLVTKARGKYRAKEELKRRGIPEELIEEAMAEFTEDNLSRLGELIEKKYARKLSEEGGLKKVKAALARQGFGFDEINKALEEFGSDWD